MDGAGEVPVGKRRVALVDQVDLALVSAFTWYPVPKGNGVVYATALINGKPVRMHRLILGARDNQIVDHKNRDGLDNRRSNLRFCTPTQNNANNASKRGRSGFRGVYPEPSGLWRAAISIGDRMLYLGIFATKQMAAARYDEEALLLYGKFARLNFPNQHTWAGASVLQEVHRGT